jgi:hypothetical protein
MMKKERVAANAADAQAKTPDAASGPATAAAALASCEAVIEYRLPEKLRPNPRNARTHSEKQVHLLAAAIGEFGVFVPVVVDENDVILAGHARVEAAKLLGMVKVPTIRVKHLTPVRKRAFVLADNRLAELAGWDDELLADELGELFSSELDFEVEITGFDTVDIDRLEAATAEQTVEQEVVPEPDRKEPPVSAVATSGSSGPTDFSVAAPWKKNLTAFCSATSMLRWSSAIHRTTFRSTAMSVAWDRSSTPSSRWRPARCRARNSPLSLNHLCG